MIASVITPATTAPLVACRKRQKMPRRKASRASSSPTCGAVSKTESEPRRGTVALKNAMVSTAATMALTLGAGSALAEGTPAETFAKTCAGCQAAGGTPCRRRRHPLPAGLGAKRRERRGHHLQADLRRENKMLLRRGMREPRGQCTLGRETGGRQRRGLAEYVLEQSKAGWK